MATSLTLQNDASLAQGYVKVNGTTSATFTTSGITGNLTGNVTGSLTAGGSLTLATAQNASGTSVDFTGIPSWVKRITVMFNGVSTSGTSELRLQLGTSSGVTASGYNGFSKRITTTGLSTSANITNGIGVQTINVDAVRAFQGVVKIYNLTGNTWVSEIISQGNDDTTCIGVSNVSLASVIDRVRFTTLNGTDTFDAGTINISYEG